MIFCIEILPKPNFLCLDFYLLKMDEKEEIENGDSSVATETSSEKRIGCAHYKRRAKFVVR